MKINIREQGIVGRLADYAMYPLMILLQGTWKERPQRTHRWNNIKLTAADVHHLEDGDMVSISGSDENSPRFFLGLPLFHMPIIGGWKEYIVLTPTIHQDAWFIGWIAGDVAGVSQIKLQGAVRVLRGQYAAQFFGVNEHGEQIAVTSSGSGTVGQAPIEHQHIELL